MPSPSPSQGLLYIINHVGLPPKLPHEAESAELTAYAERTLLDLVSSGAQRFGQQCGLEFKAQWKVVHEMLERWSATDPHSSFSELLLERAITGMKTGGEFDAALLLSSPLTVLQMFCLSGLPHRTQLSSYDTSIKPSALSASNYHRPRKLSWAAPEVYVANFQLTALHFQPISRQIHRSAMNCVTC